MAYGQAIAGLFGSNGLELVERPALPVPLFPFSSLDSPQDLGQIAPSSHEALAMADELDEGDDDETPETFH